MSTYKLQDDDLELEALSSAVEGGEDVLFVRDDKPVAMLVSLSRDTKESRAGNVKDPVADASQPWSQPDDRPD